jgi:hypothetical protein
MRIPSLRVVAMRQSFSQPSRFDGNSTAPLCGDARRLTRNVAATGVVQPAPIKRDRNVCHGHDFAPSSGHVRPVLLM